MTTVGIAPPTTGSRVRILTVVLCGAVVLMSLIPGGWGPTAGAAPTHAGAEGNVSGAPKRQTDPRTTLELISASSFVAPSGTFQATFRRPTGLPGDAVVRTTIHQRITGSLTERRRQVADLLDGDDAGPALRNAIVIPASLVTTNDTINITLPIRDRAGPAERLLVPNEGVYPVTVDVLSGGNELGNAVVFLNRTPGNSGAPLRIAVLTAVQSTGSYDANGTVQPLDKNAARVDELLTALGETRLPLTVEMDPSALEALSADAGTQSLVEDLRVALAGRTVLRRPWADVDTSAWSGAGRDELVRQLEAASGALRLLSGIKVDTTVWPLDPTLGPAGLPALQHAGVTSLLLDATQLPADQADVGASLRRVDVSGEGVTMPSLVTIPDVQGLANNPEGPVPASRANGLAALLNTAWAEQGTTDPLSALVDLGAAKPEIQAAVLRSLEAVAPDTGIQLTDTAQAVTTAAQLTERPRRGRTSSPVVVTPNATSTEPLPIDRVQALNDLRADIGSYSAVFNDPAGAYALNRLVLLSADQRLGSVPVSGALDHLRAELQRAFARISAPPDRNVTLTSADATLPIRLENASGRPVTVSIDVQSNRIDADLQKLVNRQLQPGSNRIDLPVRVRTSGAFTIRVVVRSPDGRHELTRSAIAVRSQAFNGVGLALSVGAGAFLVLWWLATHRRRRRTSSQERHPCNGDPTAGVDSTDDPTTKQEPVDARGG